METQDKRFFKGAAWLAISALILKLIGLIYKVPLSYMLGDEGMGYFNSAYTVYTFFYIVGTAGIPKAISILVSKSEAENNNKGRAIFKASFLFFFIFGTLLFLIFILFGKTFAVYIGNEPSLFSMYAIAPSILFVCAQGVVRGYLTGKMRFVPIAISELISGGGKLVFGLLLAKIATDYSLPLTMVCALTIFGITLGSFFSLIFLLVAYKREGKGKVYPKVQFKKTITEVIRLALPITAAAALSGVANIVDLTLIMNGLNTSGYSETVSAVLYGNYTTLALPMFSLVTTIITPIATALMPSLTQDLTRGNLNGFKEKIDTAMTLTSFIAVPCAVFYFTNSYDILSSIFEKSSAVLGFALLSFIAPSLLILAPLTVINTALEAGGNVKLPVISLISGTVLKLVLSSHLIRNEAVGIIAAPISTFFSYLFSLALSSLFIRRCFEVKVGIIKHTLFPLTVSAVSVIIGAFARKILFKVGDGRIFSLLILAIMGATYLVLSVLLSKKLRKKLHSYVKINKKE